VHDLTDISDASLARPTDDTRQTCVGLYLLKKLDLKPDDGGLELPIVLPSDLAPIDEPLQQLAVDGRIEIHARKQRYALTPSGIAYLGAVIDEAAGMVEELDDLEPADAIAELRTRKRDLLRARFLWGWYTGELDDLVLFQEQRGANPVERLWAYYLTSDALWHELARDLAPPTR
jgi:hypothetical protein